MSTTTQPWYVVRAKTAIAAASQGVAAAAEIYIYGDIGESWYEETVSAAQFVRDLNALNVDAITVRINSLGGSVPDGLAIYNAMKRHRATITVEVDAIAYSIASLIAMGGDQIHMASNALMMIHAPWTGVYGNSTDLREMADQLLVGAEAVQRRGIEMVHAQIERAQQQAGRRLGRRRHAIGMAEVHAAQTDRRDLGRAEAAQRASREPDPPARPATSSYAGPACKATGSGAQTQEERPCTTGGCADGGWFSRHQ